MGQWAEAKAQADRQEAVQAAATPEAKTPDIPPYIAKCVRYGLALSKQQQAANKAKGKGKQQQTAEPKKAESAGSASADELVLAELKTKAEREACAKAVLAYYKTIQQANKTAAKKS